MSPELLVAVPIGVLVLIVFWIIGIFNRFVRLENLVRESWADIDVQLKRRHDLIPNLVETVKGYATHEERVLRAVTEARALAVQMEGQLKGRSGVENDLARAVGSLLARVEAYPDLRASANFLELQRELSNTEDRIAAARRFYNANVRELKVLRESFPSSMMAGGRMEPEYYEIDSIEVRAVPAVRV